MQRVAVASSRSSPSSQTLKIQPLSVPERGLRRGRVRARGEVQRHMQRERNERQRRCIRATFRCTLVVVITSREDSETKRKAETDLQMGRHDLRRTSGASRRSRGVMGAVGGQVGGRNRHLRISCSNKALSRGIPTEEVAHIWGGHTKWCDANGKDYGGRLWDALLDKVIERMKEADAPRRRAERAGRSIRQEAARRKPRPRSSPTPSTRSTRSAWAPGCGSLRRQLAGRGAFPVTAIEAYLAREEPPPGYENASAWLMESMAGFRTYDGQQPPRPNGCGECGLPVRSWRAPNGYVYRSGKCSDHEQAARREQR